MIIHILFANLIYTIINALNQAFTKTREYETYKPQETYPPIVFRNSGSGKILMKLIAFERYTLTGCGGPITGIGNCHFIINGNRINYRGIYKWILK